MSLRAGTQLGPYTIGPLLGVGGMGEVYHATDPRLGRDVAIKILLSSDASEEQVRRFEQEAKAAGILNHPNVLTVYDVGGERQTLFIVSELLQGSTVRGLLDQEHRLPIRRTIDLAMQIARGLDAAHHAGIIHRDLKPENLFVMRDGRLKILDFGVAKLRIAKTLVPDGNAPTVRPETQTGKLVGTVSYMAPEQLRGETIDHRADIFALGVVLYEMLCGTRPFSGTSSFDVMHSIVHDDVAPPSANRSGIPAGLETIVLSCLAKNPEERFQSARDVALALQAVATPSASSESLPAPATPRFRAAPLLATVGVVVAAIAATALITARLRPTAIVPSERSAPTFARITYRRGTISAARFALGGREVIYSAAFDGQPAQVYVTTTESAEPRSLNVNGTLTSVTNDEIGVIADGTLMAVPLFGGAARKLASDVVAADAGPRGFALARSDGEVEYPIGRVIYRGGYIVGDSVRVSPAGQWIAFIEKNPGGTHANTYDVVAIDASGRKRFLSRDWPSIQPPAWTRDGKELWFTASRSDSPNELYAVTPEGRQRLVTRFQGSVAIDDIAPNGDLLFDSFDQRLETFASSAGRENPLSVLTATDVVDLSRDGRTALLADSRGGAQYAYLRATDGAPPMRLSSGIAIALSPDASRAIVMTDDGRQQLLLAPVGVGVPVPLPLGNLEAASWSVSWFPDGRRIVFQGHERGHAPRLYVQTIASGAITPLSAENVSLPSRRAVSPDGRRILVQAPDFELLDATTGALQPARGFVAGDIPMQWSRDGAAVFVMQSRDCPARVVRVDPLRGTRSVWRDIAPADRTGVERIWHIKLSDDEKTCVYSFYRSFATLFVGRGIS